MLTSVEVCLHARPCLKASPRSSMASQRCRGKHVARVHRDSTAAPHTVSLLHAHPMQECKQCRAAARPRTGRDRAVQRGVHEKAALLVT